MELAAAATQPTSLTSRRHDFVTREIENAAMRVMAIKGFNEATVADIADEAGISRRTFFRYFSSKDQLIRAHLIRLNTRVLRALERRPSDETPFDALCQAFIETAESPPEEREAIRIRNQALLGSLPATVLVPELIDKSVDLIATRMGVDSSLDQRPGLLVSTVWAAATNASRSWATASTDEPLSTALQNAFGFLGRGLK